MLPLEDLTVAEGSDAVLTCCVCGRPTPTFEWSRTGHRIDVGRVVYDQLSGNLRLEVSQSVVAYVLLSTSAVEIIKLVNSTSISRYQAPYGENIPRHLT